MKRVVVDDELHYRLEHYSAITGKSIRASVAEALEFWLDTCGEVDIESVSGQSTFNYPTAVPVTLNHKDEPRSPAKVIPMIAKVAAAR